MGGFLIPTLLRELLAWNILPDCMIRQVLVYRFVAILASIYLFTTLTFKIVHLYDGHVALHDGERHLPLLLRVLLNSSVHDQKATLERSVPWLQALLPLLYQWRHVILYLILSQGHWLGEHTHHSLPKGSRIHVLSEVRFVAIK